MNKRDLKKFQENYTEFVPGVDHIGTTAVPLVADGFVLAIHFDQKDEVKQWGALWDPTQKYWWLPLREVESGRTTLRELNQRKMVQGWHGVVDSPEAARWIHEDEPDHEYMLTDGEKSIKFCAWLHHDLCMMINSRHIGPDNGFDSVVALYETLGQGRTSWNNLMEKGYRRLKNDPVSS